MFGFCLIGQFLHSYLFILWHSIQNNYSVTSQLDNQAQINEH